MKLENGINCRYRDFKSRLVQVSRPTHRRLRIILNDSNKMIEIVLYCNVTLQGQQL